MVLASPPAVHRDQAVAAAQPANTSSSRSPWPRTRPNAAAMVDACRAAGVRLSVVSQHRFRDTPAAAHRLIADGAIGDVRMIRLTGAEVGLVGPQGARRRMEARSGPADGVGLVVGAWLRPDPLAQRQRPVPGLSPGSRTSRASRPTSARAPWPSTSCASGAIVQVWMTYEMPKPGLASTWEFVIVGSTGILRLDPYGQLLLGRNDDWEVVAEMPELRSARCQRPDPPSGVRTAAGGSRRGGPRRTRPARQWRRGARERRRCSTAAEESARTGAAGGAGGRPDHGAQDRRPGPDLRLVLGRCARGRAGSSTTSGYDYLWGHDHLYSTGGDPYQGFFEGWTTLAAWAALDQAGPPRAARRRQHVPQPGCRGQDGRDRRPHQRWTVDPGPGRRERRVREPRPTGSTRAGRWASGSTGSRRRSRSCATCWPGARSPIRATKYQFDHVRHAPLPLQPRIPVVIGAEGEKRGLRMAARHGDIWQWFAGTDEVELFRHKDQVLRGSLRDRGPRRAADRADDRLQADHAVRPRRRPAGWPTSSSRSTSGRHRSGTWSGPARRSRSPTG